MAGILGWQSRSIQIEDVTRLCDCLGPGGGRHGEELEFDSRLVVAQQFCVGGSTAYCCSTSPSDSRRSISCKTGSPVSSCSSSRAVVTVSIERAGPKALPITGQNTFSVWVKLVSGSGTFSLNYYSGATNSSDLETVVATTTPPRM